MTVSELIETLTKIKECYPGANDADVDIAIVTDDGSWVHGYDCYATFYDGKATIYGDVEREEE